MQEFTYGWALRHQRTKSRATFASKTAALALLTTLINGSFILTAVDEPPVERKHAVCRQFGFRKLPLQSTRAFCAARKTQPLFRPDAAALSLWPQGDEVVGTSSRVRACLRCCGQQQRNTLAEVFPRPFCSVSGMDTNPIFWSPSKGSSNTFSLFRLNTL